MKRTQINLGNYQYICEFYKNGVDFKDNRCQNKFMILRKFEIYNDIVYDKDIFFIEKTLFDNLENNKETDSIVFPIHDNKNIMKFSNLGELFSYYNISSINEFAYDIKCEKTNDYIKCDKIRIYNPTIKKDLDFIVYIDNYINDIHFHYICNLSNNYDKQYSKEFIINNNRYIEYIEIMMPNLDFLFDEENKVYFIDDFNKIKTTNNINNYFSEKTNTSN